MNREEAIESFKCSNKQSKLRLEVEKMRMDSGEIKELEFYIERDEMAIKALEQEPCDNAVSRQDVLDLAKKGVLVSNGNYESVCKAINELPSVNPQPCEDAIGRAEAVRVASGYCHPANVAKELAKLPPVNPQPCEDAISRQAVIKYLCTNMNWYDEDGETADDEEKLNAITDLVNGVPSVTPQPKTGHWIYTEYHTWCCSECGGNPHKGTGFVPNKDGMKMRWKYCNLCGARMVEPQES